MFDNRLLVTSFIIFGAACCLGHCVAQDHIKHEPAGVLQFESLARMVRLTHSQDLPAIDRVEVFALAFATSKHESPKTDLGDFLVRPAVPSVENDPASLRSPEILAKIIASKSVTGKTAKMIANDWRSLEFEANGAFCHIPAYGVRFLRGDHVLLSAPMCWKCHNFYIPSIDPSTGHAGVDLYGFDDNSAAKKLLNDLRRLLPHPQIQYPRIR